MLVLDESSSLRLVTQCDHARLASEILSLWREDGLPSTPWRSTLLEATREHDNGWQGADAAPAVCTDTGWPCDFREIPAAERQRIWRVGVSRFEISKPKIAYLIVRHAIRLHQDRLEQPVWVDFARFLDEKRADLAAACGPETEALEAAHDFLWLADTLSLGACGAPIRPNVSHQRYDARIQTGVIEIAPFPFAGKLTLTVPCRSIPKRRYGGEAELGATLAEARWASFAVSIESRAAP